MFLPTRSRGTQRAAISHVSALSIIVKLINLLLCWGMNNVFDFDLDFLSKCELGVTKVGTQTWHPWVKHLSFYQLTYPGSNGNLMFMHF